VAARISNIDIRRTRIDRQPDARSGATYERFATERSAEDRAGRNPDFFDEASKDKSGHPSASKSNQKSAVAAATARESRENNADRGSRAALASRAGWPLGSGFYGERL